MPAVVHATTTAQPDNPAYDVSADEWNAAHTVDFGEAGDIAAVGTAGAAGASGEIADAAHVHAHEAAHINHDTTWAAKGDLIAGTANDTAAIRAVGTDSFVLTADSAQATGLNWMPALPYDARLDKGSNEDVTNSAALQNDDAFAFALTSGGLYYFEFYLFYELQSGSAADIKIAFGEDAINRGHFVAQGISTADAAQTPVAIIADQAATASFGGTGNPRMIIVIGSYRSGGGTFRLLWAQNSATPGVYTRMRSESFALYKRFI